ncbi:MAG: copper resistance protein CopC [Chloroflexota bacterium]|nr:copper resistance protein CopC [Chloroflexota bacterium]
MTPSQTMLVRAALLGALALLLVGAPVAAHADLEGSEPAEGDTVAGAPAEVSGVFTEPLDPAASRLVLVDEAGERLAEGGVDPDDASATTMRLEPPALAPGVYEVRWTARTPDDGGVTRGRWSFTVATATETPSPSPGGTPASSAEASVPLSSAEPSAPPASVTPTAAASPSPAATPGASPPTPDQSGSDPLGGVAVPLLALGAVAAAAVLYLARRPR